jgi:SAM-dependent methyltransferase
MDQVQWLYEKKEDFSVELNGYRNPPTGPYMTTLPLIDRDGKISDLGCGNGMLLKFFLEFSDHLLEPFGIDKNPKAIQRAKEILPAHAQNFMVKDVNEYDFSHGPFDLIVGNPFYIEADERRAFTEKCLDNLYSGGRLVYRIHNDVLNHFQINNLEELPYLRNLGMKTSQGYGLSFCIFDKYRL